MRTHAYAQLTRNLRAAYANVLDTWPAQCFRHNGLTGGLRGTCHGVESRLPSRGPTSWRRAMAGANRSKWVHQAHFNVTLLKGLFLGSILSLQWHEDFLHTCTFSCNAVAFGWPHPWASSRTTCGAQLHLERQSSTFLMHTIAELQ